MSDNKSISSYRDILKGTSIFGGTQVFYAFVGILRAKFIAILLGTTGMGINALLYSACLPLQQIASFGLNVALVKEISGADDEEKRRKAIMLGKRTFLWASLAGAFLCIILSPVLSFYTFGDYSYTLSFVALGALIFFAIMSGIYISVLQGLRELKTLAWATVWGSAAGLIICIPLYYFLGNSGIVPGLIAIAFCNWLVLKIKTPLTSYRDTNYSFNQHKQFLRSLLTTGVVMTASGILSSGTAYLINIFIRYISDTSYVGFYQAANSITNQYAAIVFAAMAADYFPRLVAASKAKSTLSTVINRQMEIVMLIIIPIACIVIAMAPLIIRILLAESFESIVPLVRLFGISVILKAASYPLGYVTLANDNKKVFLVMDGFVGNLIFLLFVCAGFYFYGMEGMGVGMIANELLITIIYIVVNKKLYRYKFTNGMLMWLFTGIFLSVATLALAYVGSIAVSYTSMAIICVFATLLCLSKLKKLIKHKEEIVQA